ncbi:MAG: c-type cytochrome, partial [Woeseiaceae bacterium]|nr:c-type cytochrome [Woeseiaceae bacterium]
TNAEGIQAINAPRMAGMTDWYMASQLKNFREGIRGGHPEDYYGKQMGFMGRQMQDDKQINDVIAYINSL